jgi:hypothetical protein
MAYECHHPVMNYMLITADPEVAHYAEQSGVSRVFVDMEVMGKAERQGHLDTHRACHTFSDVSKVRARLSRAELMVRLNPLYSGTRDDVDRAIDSGAQRLMLPMFRTRREVACFMKIVDARVPITFLLETPEALVRLSQYISDLGVGDEIHVGLNDLSLGLGLDFLFEPVAGGLLDRSATLLNKNGVRWGFGGVARLDSGILPAYLILSEHVRLGSSWVILSRAFHECAAGDDSSVANVDFALEINKLNKAVSELGSHGHDVLHENSKQFADKAFAIGVQRAMKQPREV